MGFNSGFKGLSMHLTKWSGWLCKNGSAYAADGGVDSNVPCCLLIL